VQTTAQTQSK